VLLRQDKENLGSELKNGSTISVGEDGRSAKLDSLRKVLEDNGNGGPKELKVSAILKRYTKN